MAEEVDVVIKNCMILSMSNLGTIENGLIAARDGTITYVGSLSHAPKIKAEKIIEGRGKLAMPGLINCHTHATMTLFRGLAEDKPLDKWLKEVIWPLEAKLRPSDVYFGALLGCLEMIKNGVTCFADMYFFEPQVAKAVEKAGLRAVLASGIIEAGDPEGGEKMFREAVDFVKAYQGHAEGRITTFLGPHAVFSCSEELLAEVREKAYQLSAGITIHVAESKEMAEKIRRESGFTEVGLLEKLGFLDKDVLAAHCIHLTQKDMATLAMRGVKVAHNPVANMKLVQGIANVKELMDTGVTVGLGTDGAASNNSLDVFETMKIATLLQKVRHGDSTVLPSGKVLEMATVEGAKALGLEKRVGSLDVGKRADIILVDLKKPSLTPLHNLCASLVYSAHGCDVDTVIVDGHLLMENHLLEMLDEGEVMEEAQSSASGLLTRLG